MKILYVALPNSIHTARWINQIGDQGWKLYLFPSVDTGTTNAELKNVRIFHTFFGGKDSYNRNVKTIGIPLGRHLIAVVFKMFLKLIFKDYHKAYLKLVIRLIKPDIIHSMEFQQGAYLVNEVKKEWKGKFPKWIATNWGSDIYLFGRFDEHKSRIESVLKNCDFYSCECNRDVCLAKNIGLKGMPLPVFPNSGGYDLERIKEWRSGKPSSRKVIMLKGYQGWAGRAMVGLRALERCKDLLTGYKIVVYSIQPNSGMEMAIDLFKLNTNIPVEVIPLNTSHDQLLKLHGKARMSIGVSISDAISTGVLEAIVMGSFPIQTSTSCADEWIKDGETGLLIPPEDPDVIEKAIRRALADDGLVDAAAKKNYETAIQRLDYRLVKNKTIDFYNKVVK
jgi:glycosyltransferase involved in cell wall biosynthesis